MRIDQIAQPGKAIAKVDIVPQKSTAVLRVSQWGWLPTFALVSACMMMLVAIAFNGSRTNANWAQPLFWAAIFAFILPAAFRLASDVPTRQETVGILLVMTLGLYLVKLFYSPSFLGFYDELVMWRTTNDIAQTVRLFGENPILPESSLYPGLNIITQALVSVGGFTIFQAGVLLIGVAKLLLVAGLFMVYEEICGSSRIAGIAVFLYMSNLHFLLFDAQYSYESLAIPLAVFTLYAVLRSLRSRPKDRLGPTIASLLGISAVSVTHHITSYALVTFLFLWIALTAFFAGWKNIPKGLLGLAVFAFVIGLAWTLCVASPVVDYVGSNLKVAAIELFQLISGERAPRQLFQGTAQPATLWVRITSVASIGFIVMSLPFGALIVWRNYRRNAIALALGLAALVYPITLAARFTPFGLQISSRVPPYLFIGVGFVLAVGAVQMLRRYPANWRMRLAVVGWSTTILAGSISPNFSAWGWPGPYLPNSYTRSVDQQGIMVAEWMRDALGRGNRLLAEQHPNTYILGSYGEQRPVTFHVDNIWLSPVLQSFEFSDDDLRLLKIGGIRYVVVDQRQSPALVWPSPETLSVLTKFDELHGASRVFDNGDVAIYDMGELTRDQ